MRLDPATHVVLPPTFLPTPAPPADPGCREGAQESYDSIAFRFTDPCTELIVCRTLLAYFFPKTKIDAYCVIYSLQYGVLRSEPPMFPWSTFLL